MLFPKDHLFSIRDYPGLQQFFFLHIFFNFTIFYWICHISTWIHHRYTRGPHPEPSSLLPPHTIPLSRPSAPAPRESTLNTLWEGLMLKLRLHTSATWCKQLTHWKRPWCWEWLKAEDEEGNRGLDVGWHYWFTGHEPGQTPGDGKGQRSMVCCGSCDHKGLEKTWWLYNKHWVRKYDQPNYVEHRKLKKKHQMMDKFLHVFELNHPKFASTMKNFRYIHISFLTGPLGCLNKTNRPVLLIFPLWTN